MSRDHRPDAIWRDPALGSLVEPETAAVLWSLDGGRIVSASSATAGLAPALRAAGGESLRGRLRRIAAALSSGSGVRLERVTLPQGYGVARLLLECHRVATGEGEYLLTILRGQLPRLPRLVGNFDDGIHEVPDPETLSPDNSPALLSLHDDDGGGLERLLAYAGKRASVRFVWEMDAQGRFTRISPELAALVGDNAAALIGRQWGELLDAGIVVDDGALGSALDSRDTWSGKTVLWRIGGAGVGADAPRLPVEMAGIPVHDGGRRFHGYRGFGLCRIEALRDLASDHAVAGPVELRHAQVRPIQVPPIQVPPSQAPSSQAPSSQARHSQVPPLGRRGLHVVPSQADTEAAEGDSASAAAPRSRLTDSEKQAFRDIARALGGARLSQVADDEAQSEISGAGRASSGQTPVLQEANAPSWLAVEAKASIDSPIDEGAHQRKTLADASAQEALVPEEPLQDVPLQPAPPKAVRRQSVPAQVAPARDAPARDAPAQAAPVETATPAKLSLSATDAATEMVAHVAERLPLAILVSRGEEVLFANRALLDMLGYADLPAFVAAGGLKALFMGAPGGGDAPLALRTAQGVPLSADARMATVPWRGSAAALMSFRRAVEPRVEAHLRDLERELRSQEARMRDLDTILDTATDGVVVVDGDLRMQSMNRSAEALFGCEETEVVGRPFTDLIDPASRADVAAYFDAMRTGGLSSVLNDGREVVARALPGGRLVLQMLAGRLGEFTASHGENALTRRAQPAGPRFFAILRDLSHLPTSTIASPAPASDDGLSRVGQTEFLARVSHEIRTPLNAIIGFAEIMLEERFGPIANERYLDYLRGIHASGGQVIRLVNDLLDLARIEAGRLELAPADIVLNDVVSGCVSLLMPQAGRQQVVLRTSLSRDLPAVTVDERALQQIILNLLSNAIRFTDAGGQVIISTARADDGGVTLRIRDTGVGMTRAQISAALEPFTQLTTTRLGQGGGVGQNMGLGLPLTRALVEASGGRFRVESVRHEGTLVEIALPRARHQAHAQTIARPSSQ